MGEDGENPPPLQALAAHHLAGNTKGYLVTGDYSTDSPPSDLIRAVSQGEVDLAIAWGPLAGYYAARAAPPLALGPVPESDAPAGQTFAFDIALGVRRADVSLRGELDGILARRHVEIEGLLDSFGVPRF